LGVMGKGAAFPQLRQRIRLSSCPLNTLTIYTSRRVSRYYVNALVVG
jgi:hypothetical protein